jgi:Fic family protein
MELKNYYPGELEKYRESFDIRYVYHTTAIEGNTLTIQETGLVLDKGLAPARKKLREIHEVENFRKVLEFRRSYKKEITPDFILKLHELIQRNIDDESAGAIRKVQIFISGSNYEPPPAIVVEEELKALIKWYNNNRKKMNPLELAADFHHRFEEIHPFVDGNGRVGRELMNFILQKNGYPAIIIPVERREEYIDALEDAHNGNLKPFLEFLVEIFVEDYAKVIRGNMEKFLQEFGELDQDELQEILEMVKWSSELTKKYIEKTPKHLLEIIQGIMM